MESVAGRTAVVTGAGSGIGRALGIELAREGAIVAMLDVDDAALQHMMYCTPSDVPDGRLRPYVVDVLDREAYAAAAQQIENDLGGVEILVNNAGVAFNSKPIWETDYKDIDWCVGVNIFGAIHGVKNFVPGMVSRERGGHVVSTASIGGFQVRKSELWHQALYAATKAALVALSEGLRQDLEQHGIGVTILAPSAVRTRIATSDRNRPGRFGGPGTGAQDSRVEGMLAEGKDPSEVARLAYQAILEDRQYVFTESRDRALVEARHRQIEAAFPAHG